MGANAGPAAPPAPRVAAPSPPQRRRPTPAIRSWRAAQPADDTHRPHPLPPSQAGIDWGPLRDALASGDLLAADDVHRKKLIELAGPAAVERGWVYFSEVKSMPATDLRVMDALWRAASGGKFGFSAQREVWRSTSKRWGRFFKAIDWVQGPDNAYRKWPGEFTYAVDPAPKGHLPLTNALRGTQLFEAILDHPAWDEPAQGAVAGSGGGGRGGPAWLT
jgi:hypothetical protein